MDKGGPGIPPKRPVRDRRIGLLGVTSPLQREKQSPLAPSLRRYRTTSYPAVRDLGLAYRYIKKPQRRTPERQVGYDTSRPAAIHYPLSHATPSDRRPPYSIGSCRVPDECGLRSAERVSPRTMTTQSPGGYRRHEYLKRLLAVFCGLLVRLGCGRHVKPRRRHTKWHCPQHVVRSRCHLCGSYCGGRVSPRRSGAGTSGGPTSPVGAHFPCWSPRDVPRSPSGCARRTYRRSGGLWCSDSPSTRPGPGHRSACAPSNGGPAGRLRVRPTGSPTLAGTPRTNLSPPVPI